MLVRVTTTAIRRCNHEVKRAPKQEALAAGAGGPDFIYLVDGSFGLWKSKERFLWVVIFSEYNRSWVSN